MKIVNISYISLLAATLLFVACKKNSDSPAVPDQAPVIKGISPAEGPLGTQVTISGKGFNATMTLDTVYFNGQKAVIISASDTILVVTVPPQAGTGDVVVNVKGTSTKGPVFTYDFQYIVSTLAGGASSSIDGTGVNAGFGVVNDIANDGNGNLYVGDMSTDYIRKITSDKGVVTTFAGSGLVTNDADGSLTTAAFASPADVIATGNTIYVLDAGSGLIGASIRMISGTTVTTIAGGGSKGSANGTGTAAHFDNSYGFAMDASGNFYVADVNNNKIRKVTAAGVTTTFAGSGGQGSQDATGTSATFNGPLDVAIDGSGNLFVSDESNNKIRKITPAGVVTTFAGSGLEGSADGTGTAASFSYPSGLTFDKKGNLYVADMYNNKIRMITPQGVVTTIAGTGDAGLTDGPAKTALFAYPTGLTVDANGNIYVADGNPVIRKITLQ